MAPPPQLSVVTMRNGRCCLRPKHTVSHASDKTSLRSFVEVCHPQAAEFFLRNRQSLGHRPEGISETNASRANGSPALPKSVAVETAMDMDSGCGPVVCRTRSCTQSRLPPYSHTKTRHVLWRWLSEVTKSLVRIKKQLAFAKPTAYGTVGYHPSVCRTRPTPNVSCMIS